MIIRKWNHFWRIYFLNVLLLKTLILCFENLEISLIYINIILNLQALTGDQNLILNILYDKNKRK